MCNGLALALAYVRQPFAGPVPVPSSPLSVPVSVSLALVTLLNVVLVDVKRAWHGASLVYCEIPINAV